MDLWKSVSLGVSPEVQKIMKFYICFCPASSVALGCPVPVTNTVASLTLDLPDDDRLVEVFQRWHDDLPAHVLGKAYWSHAVRDGQRLDARQGYRVHINGNTFYVEFINHAWYLLEKRGDEFVTKRSLRIERENEIGLGWWNNTDKEHPERLPATRAPEPTDPPEEGQLEYINEDVVISDPVDELTAAFRHLTPIPIDLPLVDESPEPEPTEPQNVAIITSEPINASAPVITPSIPVVPTIAPVITPAVPMATPGSSSTPSSGGKLSGNAPRIFDGMRDKSKTFIREFDLYRGMNKDAKIMKSPYQHVFLALSFIRGPNWIDAAQTEQRKYAMIRARVGLDSGGRKIAGKTKNDWRQMLMPSGGNRQRPTGNGAAAPARDPDAMDVDVARTQPLAKPSPTNKETRHQHEQRT
ncbi:hypothetical protein EDB83DRAFT_2310543 [Lactarius deliciosus]|nr:hypothetical protein EDB83DRAFT_2310543 [Lactarius deliciosus]